MKRILSLLVLILAACSTAPKQVAAPVEELPALRTEVVHELRLKESLEKGRGAMVVSASGLVKVDDRLYTIADDDDAIFAIDKDGTTNVVWRGATLPTENKLRKKAKPDFESIMMISADDWKPAGALVAWPSASGKNRQKAVVLPFTAKGRFGKAKRVDIVALADKLRLEEKFINMEGIFIRGDDVFLVHRGNAPGAHSGLFKISKKEWLSSMHSGDWSKVNPTFQTYALGEWRGVPLAFAEAQVTSAGLLALATGEATDDKLQDGAVSGTVLIRLEDDGKVTRLGHFPEGVKLEGFIMEADAKSLLLVDDADQVTTPSKLYRAWLPETQNPIR